MSTMRRRMLQGTLTKRCKDCEPAGEDRAHCECRPDRECCGQARPERKPRAPLTRMTSTLSTRDCQLRKVYAHARRRRAWKRCCKFCTAARCSDVDNLRARQTSSRTLFDHFKSVSRCQTEFVPPSEPVTFWLPLEQLRLQQTSSPRVARHAHICTSES